MAQLQFRSDDSIKWREGFGSGADGALTISADTTETVIDSGCTGTATQSTLSATNAGFTPGQIIWIHKTRGNTTTTAGTWEINKIASYAAGTINLLYPLQNSYQDSGADQSQVRVLLQYTDATINSGKTLTAKAWDGNTGGIIGLFASGTVTVTGNISASSKGFVGGAGQATGNGNDPTNNSRSGEGTSGDFAAQQTANGNGGGRGYADGDSSGGFFAAGGGGGAGSGGGGNGTGYNAFYSIGIGGNAVGVAGLTTMDLGGGGGGGAVSGTGTVSGGGTGGGMIVLFAKTISIGGTLVTLGGASGTANTTGGAGGGGSILIKAQTATLGTALATATGGTAATATVGGKGGDGGTGRIHLDYKDSYTGTTNPAIDARQDLTLDYPSGWMPFFI